MKKGSKLGAVEVAAMKKKKSNLRSMNGLKKKLSELSTLCGVEGFLIILGSDGKQQMGEIPIQQQSETWPENKDQCLKIINRYKEYGHGRLSSGLVKEEDSRSREINELGKDEEDGFRKSSSIDESVVNVDDCCLGMNSTGNNHQADTVMDAIHNLVSPLIEVEQQHYDFYNSECSNGCGGGDESCNNATCWDQLNDLTKLNGDQQQMMYNFENSVCFNGGGRSCNNISWDQLTGLIELNDDQQHQMVNSLENSECFLLSDGGGTGNNNVASYQNPIIDEDDPTETMMFQMMMHGYIFGYSHGASGNNVLSSISEEADQFMLGDSSLNPQLMN